MADRHRITLTGVFETDSGNEIADLQNELEATAQDLGLEQVGTVVGTPEGENA